MLAQTPPMGWNSFGWKDLHADVINLWTGEDLGVFTRDFVAEIQPHDCMIAQIVPEK